MLQNIRKNIQGTMAKVIIALIIVPFALFGIDSLIGGSGIQYVAEVNGEGGLGFGGGVANLGTIDVLLTMIVANEADIGADCFGCD